MATCVAKVSDGLLQFGPVSHAFGVRQGVRYAVVRLDQAVGCL